MQYDTTGNQYSWSLVYSAYKKFYNCTTNKFVNKAFDYDGKETEMQQLNNLREEDAVAIKTSKFYSIFDVTTDEGNDYIVFMYNETFEKNKNVLSVTISLKKENANLDLDDENSINKFIEKYVSYEIEEDTMAQGKYEAVEIRGETYYHKLTNDKWNGEYKSYSYYTESATDKTEVVSYDDYVKYVEEVNNIIENTSNSKYVKKIKLDYKDKKSNYVILGYATGYSWCKIDLIDYVEEADKIAIYGDEEINGVMESGSGFLVVIPTKMDVGTKVEYRECYSTGEISNIQNYNTSQTHISFDKPIIYLYPTEETNVNVKLGNSDLATTLYPKYDMQNGWNVKAIPNGNLVDLSTGRNLYALYYESKAKYDVEVREDGFVVKGEDVAEFLEEKLAILGLNEREAEEFIVYWLPKLEANKYNYIRFETAEEIEANMPLDINPTPDSIIRVVMTFKGLDTPIVVQEQELTTPERTGFTVVEWGGSEIK